MSNSDLRTPGTNQSAEERAGIIAVRCLLAAVEQCSLAFDTISPHCPVLQLKATEIDKATAVRNIAQNAAEAILGSLKGAGIIK
jgi:hypothetical protein